MRKLEKLRNGPERTASRHWMRSVTSASLPGRRGVALAEMIVVVTLCGILMAVAAPKLVGSFNGRASSSAADRFVRTHELARATAARYGRNTTLHIDAAGNRFWIDVDTSGAGVRDTIGGIRSVSSAGVTFASVDTLLCFDARGLRSLRPPCQSGEGTIIFARQTRRDTVQFTALGKVLR